MSRKRRSVFLIFVLALAAALSGAWTPGFASGQLPAAGSLLSHPLRGYPTPKRLNA
jgi:hypothetical protein